jgi:hypothetical protein
VRSRRSLIKALFLVSLLLFSTAWLRYDHFDGDMPIAEPLRAAPRQAPVDEPEFTARANGVEYLVRPRYDYELWGLVVSYKRFSEDYGLHRRWNDFINLADVCVVWGANATEVDLNAFDFSNGEFTCWFSTRNPAEWERFDPDKLSNNHLITVEPTVRETIDDLAVGDQVRIRGWLAEYGEPGGPFRQTSTTRTDTGNGACETIYVAEMEILRSMDTVWRKLWWFALGGLLTAVILWFRTPYHRLRR